MRAAELLALYALAGLGFALLAVRRRRSARVVPEALMTIAFWPLYAPFLLAAAPALAPGEDDFLEALSREGSSLSGLLPGPEAVRLLAQRLRTAARRVAEIDRLLLLPEFGAEDARAREAAFAARGDLRAAAAAASRRQNIERLRSLRERFRRELEEVRELLGQLRVQAEVVRLSGAPGGGTKELVAEILARVEGLDAILAQDAAEAVPAPPPPAAAAVQ